ncbi:hypothetical protein PI124_g14490 [Phytophthora idaei]|nr:hypothetical protein PI125_g21350 [Phytophthora idaei]KAG3132759.1 hypothetical protein PI126_g19504 [Phytophthora idaei]KAG3240620.1 hypothetical protein PI124_g14490 [Phytophthora idaei]
MAGGGYSAAIQELKKSQDCLASSMSDLNFLKTSVLSTNRTLNDLQGRLILEDQARLAAEERVKALLEDVARLRALLQQEQDYNNLSDRLLLDALKRQQDRQSLSGGRPSSG